MFLIIIALIFVFALTYVKGRTKYLTIIFFSLFVLFYFCPWLIYRFSSERWKEASLIERRIMARDFVRTFVPGSMTSSDIKSLLGPSHNKLIYFLSSDRDLSKDPPALYVVFNGGVVTTLYIPQNIDSKDNFDKTKWTSASSQERTAMIKDLEARKILLGLKESDVISMLGASDDRTDARQLSYDLGMFVWLGEMDGYTLDFEIGPNDKVISANVFQH